MSMEYDRCMQNLRDMERDRVVKEKNKIDNVRRTAERGLKHAQRWAELPPYPEYMSWQDKVAHKRASIMVDVFQHILDEVSR